MLLIIPKNLTLRHQDYSNVIIEETIATTIKDTYNS